MSADCCSSATPVMILACSGGSNVGQLTNQAAVELTREGFGKMYCLAGLGAGLKSFVQAAREAPRLAVLDGCPVGCAKAILEQADLAPRGYLVLTEDLGIEKVKDQALAITAEEVAKVKAAVRSAAMASSPAAGPASLGAAGGCGCAAGRRG